ncbi:MAG: hypothetical protein WD851_16985 [Pirellulales bacterium]
MNDETRMTNDEWKKNCLVTAAPSVFPSFVIRHSSFVISPLVIRHSSFVILLAAATGAFPALHAQEPQPVEAAPDLITNPAVRAALEEPRTEPLDYVRAILVLVDLGEAPRAVPIMEELATLQLTDEQRAELVNELGSAAMLRLARIETLGPAAKEFAETTMAAAASAASSPERLGQLVEQLGGPSPDARRAAAVELASSGIAGVKFLIAALAEAPDETKRAGLRQALVGLAPLSAPPLLAVLHSGDDPLRADAIAVLAEIGGDQVAALIAVPALLEPGDSIVGQTARQAFERITNQHVEPALAEQLLRRALKNYLAGSPPFRPGEDGLVEMWLWNAEQKQLNAVRLTVEDAALLRAARLADDLARLTLGDADAKRQALLLGLEANWILGADAAEPLDLASTNPLELSQTLVDALTDRRHGAAIAIAAELGERGEAAVLYSADGKPSPLAAALNSPHPQVRYTALAAILQIDPRSPFPGSSRVAEVLTRLARSTGAQRAVVAMPPIERAATLAGQLAAQQIDAIPVELGGDAVAESSQSPDVELVLVDMAIDRPDLREVLFQLRRTAATGAVPIGILAPAGRLADAEALAGEHEGVLAFSRPHTPEANAAIVAELRLALPRGWPTAEERRVQAAQSLAWIDRLLSERRRFYNLRGRPAAIEAALTTSAVPTEGHLMALAKVGNAASQRTLVNYINQSVLPIETREQAAAAFAEAVDRHGLLLTSDEIRQQYDQYNASETADAATQQVLGAVLDAIEKKSRQQAEGSRQSAVGK